MSRTVTIRNVPDEVADELVQRANSSGRSLQSFVLSLLCREARTPAIDEVLAGVRDDARQGGIHTDTAELLQMLDEERGR
jgi:hypothetical protein